MLATGRSENGGRYWPWIKSIVDFCTDHPWLVLVTSLVLAAVSGFYAERNFAINTDIWKLISPELPWRQRQLAFDRTFPQRLESIIAVVDAPTPEFATEASVALTRRLTAQPGLFRSVRNLQDSEFFSATAFCSCPHTKSSSSANNSMKRSRWSRSWQPIRACVC